MPLYKTYNGPMPTTAAQVGVTTGTAIKTLLQIATPSTVGLQVVEWGISFNGSASAAGIVCELVDTAAINATVTAHVAAGIIQLNGPTRTPLVTLGTAATGYTGSAEGSIVATRMLDAKYVQPSDREVFTWPLGCEPEVAISRFLRVRVTAAAAVNALCFVTFREN